MGIYYKDFLIMAVFKDELINENNFKAQIAAHKIAIRIRDIEEGRGGNSTKHKDSPSIKIIDFGNGRKSNHDKYGDPIYFWMDKSGRIQTSFIGNFNNKKEIKYIKNFIIHNYNHLSNYWFAPRKIKDYVQLLNYQNKLRDRILYNISTCDYKKEYDTDDLSITF